MDNPHILKLLMAVERPDLTWLRARGNGQRQFAILDKDTKLPTIFSVALLIKDPLNGKYPARLDSFAVMPLTSMGVVTDPDGWKYLTVKIDPGMDLSEIDASIRRAVEQIDAPQTAEVSAV